MEFAIKLHTMKSGWSNVYFEGSQVIFSKKGPLTLSYSRVPTGQGKVREICFFFKVREKSGNSVK